MDIICNPFSPGAGSRPPELAGRAAVLEQSRVLMARVARQRAAKSMILIGLRGVGKTVLLNEIERQARNDNHYPILVENVENSTLGKLLAQPVRKALFELDSMKGAGDKVRRGLIALRNFLGTISFSYGDMGIGLEPVPGVADSGDIESDIPDLLIALAEAAQERKRLIVLLVDEIQYFSEKELSALIVAMHKIQQKQLPLVLVGAGLPILPGLAGESKFYAERLFDFPMIGALSEQESYVALQNPARQENAEFTHDALKYIYRCTQGYPYFLQEWGYQAWNQAEVSPIDLSVVRDASSAVMDRLDANFFRVRVDRCTPGEKRFLRAMAEAGDEEVRQKDVADVLSKNVSSLSPTRSKLIEKGMIYSPHYGFLSFTVPLFGDFLRRNVPLVRD